MKSSAESNSAREGTLYGGRGGSWEVCWEVRWEVSWEGPVELLQVQQELSELIAGVCGAVGRTARIAQGAGRAVRQWQSH